MAADVDLAAVRALLLQHRNRLWTRRIVRRSWIVVAATLLAEVVLWAVARLAPLEATAAIAVGIPLAGSVGLVLLAMLARPTLGQTALAVDSGRDRRTRRRRTDRRGRTTAAVRPAAAPRCGDGVADRPIVHLPAAAVAPTRRRRAGRNGAPRPAGTAPQSAGRRDHDGQTAA
jgi:hypothetical protein